MFSAIRLVCYFSAYILMINYFPLLAEGGQLTQFVRLVTKEYI